MRKALAFALTLLASTVVAQTEVSELVRDRDALVASAVRSSLLGDADRIALLARMRERQEKLEPGKWESLGENLASLAAATARPLMDERETAALVEGFRPDNETANVLRLMKTIEPRERFRDASADRSYEAWRRRWNSVTTAVTSVFSLQFFGLIQPPLDAIEYLAVGRKFPSPERRRELYRAREASELPMGRRLPAASDVAAVWTPRRLELAKLHATRNAELAFANDRLETANWWYGRAALLGGRTRTSTPGQIAVTQALLRREERGRAAVSVSDGDEALREPAHFEAYSRLLRAFVADSASPEIERMTRDFRVAFPLSAARDEVSIVEVLYARDAGRNDLARVAFEYLAREDSRWGRLAAGYLDRDDFTPSRAFARAEEAIAQRRRDFVLHGRDPRIIDRSLSPEEARAIEAGWITAARSAFVIDTISRFIVLPLLPGSLFPKDELFEAAGAASPKYLASSRGKEWLAKTAKAYASVLRFEESAQAYDQAGEPQRAAKMRQKAAAARETQIDKDPSWRARAEGYRGILNAYPAYKKRARVEEKLAKAERRLAVQTVIPRRELEAHPQLWKDAGLFLSPALFDGEVSNGELTDQGVTLLMGDRIAYFDKDREFSVEIAVEPGTNERVLDTLFPLRRGSDVAGELAKPLARKRIPLALEGSAMPGFDIAPGLVPLELDSRERMLYQ